jgi:hypothetical protein
VGEELSTGVRGRRARVIGVGLALALAIGLGIGLAAAFSGGDDLGAAAPPDPPVGSPVLPDLTPKPQYNVLVQKVGKRWRIRFTTIIVNVGKGDFVLRAIRDVRDGWKEEQDIQYSEAGARPVPIRGVLVWGGDGHNHWHVSRVAVVELVPLSRAGRFTAGAKPLVDGKVGFCFYDHTHELARGPAKPAYSAKSCGKQDWRAVGMGLSPGWNDTYTMTLPGQSIDVTDVPAGRYRLYTDIDPQGRFREVSRLNNRTWIDLELRWTKDGLVAPTIATGPTPS